MKEQEVNEKAEVQIKEISNLISEVRPFLVEAGIVNTNIVFKKERLDGKSEAELKSIIVWLKGFLKVHCDMITKARKLVPAHVWKNYEILGVKGTYEQDQLLQSRRLVREEWTRRPDLLKRKPNAGKSKKTK